MQTIKEFKSLVTVNNLYEAKASDSFPNKNTDKDRLSFLIVQIDLAKSVWGYVMLCEHDGEYVRLNKVDLIKYLKGVLAMEEYYRVDLDNFKVRGWGKPNGERSVWVN